MASDPRALPTLTDVLGGGVSAPKERPGLLDIMGSAAQGAWGGLRYGLPAALESAAGTLSPEDQQYYGAWNRYYQDKANAGPQAAGLDDITSGRVGLGRAFLENVAASVPYMGTALAGGIAGSLVAPGAGTTAGVVGGLLGSTAQFGGSNASRAMEANDGVLTRDAAERSLAMAPLQAASELAGARFIPGLGRFLGPLAAKFEGNVLTRTAKTAVAGFATEALTETGQQAAERYAAGLPLTGKEATQEFVQAFAIGGLVGAGFGGMAGPFRKKAQAADPNALQDDDLVGIIDEGLSSQTLLALPSPQMFGREPGGPEVTGTDTVYTDAGGRAGLGPETIDTLLATPRQAELGTVEFGPPTPTPTRGPTMQLGYPETAQDQEIPLQPPFETLPKDYQLDMFAPPTMADMQAALKSQPTEELEKISKKARANKKAVPAPVAEAVEQELAARNGTPTGGAPASASDTWTGIRLNQDLKKLQNATPEELNAGVRSLLEAGDTRKGTLTLAERLGINIEERGQPIAAPDGQVEAVDTRPWAELSPEEQAQRRAQYDEQNYQALLKDEPNLTREEYEQRKVGGMQMVRQMLGAPEAPQAAPQAEEEVQAAPQELANLFAYAKRPDTERAALSQMMKPEDLATLRREAVEALGRPLPGNLTQAQAERLNTRLQKVGEELGLLDKDGLTQEGRTLALQLPTSMTDLEQAIQAEGLEGSQAAMFARGATGEKVAKFDSLSDAAAYMAGQRWKVPAVADAQTSQDILYGRGAGALTDGGKTKSRTQVAPARELDLEQKRRMWLARAVDEGNYPEAAQLKRMIEAGATNAELDAAAAVLREGGTLFPDDPRTAPDAFEGETVTRGAPSAKWIEREQLKARDEINAAFDAGQITAEQRDAQLAQLTVGNAVAEDLGLGREATRRMIAEQKRARAIERTKRSEQRRKQDLYKQIEEAVAGGDFTVKEGRKLQIMVATGRYEFVTLALEEAATQGPVGVFRNEMNTSRRGFLAGVAATLAATAVDPKLARAQAKGTPLDKTFEGHLENGNIVGALEYLKANSSNPIYRLIASKLLRGGGWDNVTLATGPDQGPLHGTTTLNDDGSTSVELYGENGLTQETVLHELIHAYAQQRWGGIGIYNTHNEKLLKADKDRADEVVQRFQVLWSDIGKLIRKVNPELLESENPDDAWAWNAVGDPDEALSWLLTNKQAQDFLRSYDMKGNKVTPGQPSVWESVLRWLADLLGLQYNSKVQTALDEVMAAGMAVLDAGAEVKTGEFNVLIANQIARQGGRMEKSTKPPRSVPETQEALKDVVGTITKAADRVMNSSIAARAQRAFLGLQTINHMVETWGSKLDGLRDYQRIDAERHATHAKMSQLFVAWNQSVDKADDETRRRLNDLMHLTEFNADPRKRWKDQPWLHDHPNAGELKQLVDKGNEDYNNLKRKGQEGLYDEAVALNEMQLYADLAVDMYGMMAFDQEYSVAVPGATADPAKGFRESEAAGSSATAARDYWKAQLEQRVKAAEGYVEQSRGQMLSRSRKEQVAAERKLTPMEAQLSQIAGTLKSMKQGPYFHMGRHGDNFIAFTAKNTKGTIDKGALAKIQKAFGEAGLDNVYFSSANNQAAMYLRFESKEQQSLAESVLRDLQKQGALDPEVEPIAGPREASGIYRAQNAKADWLSNVLSDLKASLDAQAESADPKERAELKARYAALEEQLTAAWMESLSDNSLVKVMTRRKARPGYDSNMIRSFATRANMSALALANKTSTPQVTNAFERMKASVNDARRLTSENHGDVQGMFDVMNEVLLRQAQRGDIEKTVIGDKLRAGTNAFFLGGSIGYVVTQVTQLPVMLLPELGKKHGFSKSFSAIAKSTPVAFRIMRAVAGEAMQHKWKHWGDITITPDVLKKAGLSPAQASFITKMMASGAIDIGSAARELGHIAAMSDDSNVDSVIRLATSMGLYSETLTRLIAALSARELHGADGAEVYAHRVLDEAMFNYASSNTARLLGKKGVFGQWTPIMTQFMQYSAQLMEKLYREAHAAMGGSKEAQKFLAMHATAVAALAGTLGLPFASMAAFAIEKLTDLFDDDDEPYDATAAWRNFLASMFGKEVGDVIARGLPRAAGFDLSERIGEQDLLPFTEFLTDRRALKDAAQDQALRSFGAPVSMGVGVFSGASRIADGDIMGGLSEMLPVALRNLAKGGQLAATGKYTDSKGNHLPLTPGASDIMYQLMGLTPADRATYAEAQKDKVQRETSINREAKIIRDRIVKGALNGDQELMRDGIRAAARFDQDNPSFAILPDIQGTIERRIRQEQLARTLGTPLGVKPNDLKGQELTSYMSAN